MVGVEGQNFQNVNNSEQLVPTFLSEYYGNIKRLEYHDSVLFYLLC